MGDIIYGVDLTKEITPIMVREAIVQCFKEAHREILDLMDEGMDWKSETEREQFNSIKIRQTIQKICDDSDISYDNPTKEDLENLVRQLAGYASLFRNPEVIHKHASEITKLIDKL